MADKVHPNWRHGGRANKTVSPTYNSWVRMIQRCTNPLNPDYPDYGGRGISVCSEWRDFVNFLHDMGEAPKGLTLERLDNHTGYNPTNCKWATRQEQANNRRSSRLITYQNETLTVAQWARLSGVKFSTFKQRFYVYGWPIERCLSLSIGSRVNG